MAEDYAYDASREDGQDIAHASVLDRRIAIPLQASRLVPLSVALIAATLLRLPGLDRWPLTSAEGEVAWTSWNLLLGNDIVSNMLGQPFIVIWTALFQFLGHSTDSVVRMSAALTGVALVALVAALGRWIGVLPAAAAALLVAFSPTLVATSRRLDGGAPIVLLLLAFVAVAWIGRDRTTPVVQILLGVFAALLMLSGPLGVVGLLLAILAIVLVDRPAGVPNRPALLRAVGGFGVAYVLISTAFLTRPGSLTASTGEIFRQLFVEHLANIGDRFHVPAINLVINEPLLIALAILGLVVPARRELAKALGIWAGVALVTVSLLGDTGVAGHGLVVLPMALLAGLGAAYLIERLPWGLIKRGPGALFMVALVLMLFALLSMIGIVTPAGGLVGWTWVVNLLAVALFGVVPLVVFLALISPRITGHHLVLAVTAGLVLISAFTMRTAVLSASEWPGEPRDPLAQGMHAQSLPAVVGRIERVSIDMTRTTRTLQDPTGGHGLRIAIDADIEQPLRWNFREFPYVTVFDPAVEGPGEDAQVVFLAGHRDPASVAPAMANETYLLRFDAPRTIRDPDWGHLLGGIFRVGDWRVFSSFMIHLDQPGPEDRIEFHLALAPAVAERLFGPTGPFSLDDAAGTGVQGGQFNAPRGIAVADDGRIYVVDAGNQRIQVFDADGEFLTTFGSEGAGPGQLGRFASGQGGAGGIAISGDRVYVADTWNHRIQVFSLDGAFVAQWGGFFDARDDPAATASNPGLFYGPRGLVIVDELLYVTDTGNERVQVFDLDGEFVRLFGTPGSGEGQLLEPVGIAHHDGVILVADSHNSRIARFTIDGEPLEDWRIEAWSGMRFFEPYLAVTPDGRIIATASMTNEIVVVGSDGETALLAVGDILRPYGVVVIDDGRALVTDGLRNAVLRLAVDS